MCKEQLVLTVLAFWSAAFLRAQTSDPAATQITVTPQSAQKVIVGSPDRQALARRIASVFGTHLALWKSRTALMSLARPVTDAQYNPKQK